MVTRQELNRTLPLDIHNQRGLKTAGHFDNSQFVLGNRFDLVGERVPGRVIPLSVGGGVQPGGVDGHIKRAEKHPSQFKRSVQFADPVEKQPGGVGAGHMKPLVAIGLGSDLGEVAGDDLEEAAGSVSHEFFQRRCGHPQAQVGSVFEDLVHRWLSA